MYKYTNNQPLYIQKQRNKILQSHNTGMQTTTLVPTRDQHIHHPLNLNADLDVIVSDFLCSVFQTQHNGMVTFSMAHLNQILVEIQKADELRSKQLQGLMFNISNLENLSLH